MMKTVAIGGLGAIGLKLARALDAGVDGLRLIAVAARDQAKAEANLRGFRDAAAPGRAGRTGGGRHRGGGGARRGVRDDRLAPPSRPAASSCRPRSARCCRACTWCAARRRPARASWCRPARCSGLDAVRAAAEGQVESVTIESRKPPRGLEGAPYLVQHGIDVSGITAPKRVFEGNAFDAAAGFPANVNVAAALALAGIGPIRTRVEIWADPGIDRNTHTIRVEAEAARFTMTIENVPSEENPRTGQITALSMLACLRGLVATLKVGT